MLYLIKRGGVEATIRVSVLDGDADQKPGTTGGDDVDNVISIDVQSMGRSNNVTLVYYNLTIPAH